MKRKSTAPRNPFVAAAKFRNAGAHKKSNKALRRQEKMKQPKILDEWLRGDRFSKSNTELIKSHFASRMQTKAITRFCLYS
ncbi:MAG TPA: hypothetical protein VNW52_05630 [Burkholderiaceae bacterium]|nr:hypothetical protein [Burkholderiaceae bacterium]